MRYRLGIDTGGTCTDFVVIDEAGQTELIKVLTTPGDPSIGFLDGLTRFAESKGLTLGALMQQIDVIVHGTTVATNALLTGNVARTALLTTAGCRDVLEMRMGLREELYDNKLPPPPILVPRYRRLPVGERTRYDGAVLRPARADDVTAQMAALTPDIEAIAICFMHSYANPENERLVRDWVQAQRPTAFVTASADLLPEVRFYNRVSTTVVNAAVGPVLSRYLTRLEERLRELEFCGVLLIMASNGGVMSIPVASAEACRALLSGPAAAPIAGMAVSADLYGRNSFVTIDMGGTSFDVALVENGTPVVATAGDINRYRVAVPMLDIHTIGAGGGSIAWLDDSGLLHVGPQSAGSDPGPACYGRGGQLATVTDANVVLGYLSPDSFLGGSMKLDRQAAEAAVAEIARPLGLSVPEAAAGIYQVINVNMAAGIREVTVQRGIDPRELPLVVAGGAGPLHAAYLARELGMSTVIVPRDASTFCAGGMLWSDLRHDFVRTFHTLVDDMDPAALWAACQELHRQGEAALALEQTPPERMYFQFALDMRYRGQYHEVTVACTEAQLQGDIPAICAAFHRRHDALFGFSLAAQGDPISILNVRMTAVGQTTKPRRTERTYPERPLSAALRENRPVFLADERHPVTVPVYDGELLTPQHRLAGPAIVELPHFTLVVPADFRLACDRYDNFLMYAAGAPELAGRSHGGQAQEGGVAHVHGH